MKWTTHMAFNAWPLMIISWYLIYGSLMLNVWQPVNLKPSLGLFQCTLEMCQQVFQTYTHGQAALSGSYVHICYPYTISAAVRLKVLCNQINRTSLIHQVWHTSMREVKSWPTILSIMIQLPESTASWLINSIIPSALNCMSTHTHVAMTL